ncbi:hypothetical protein FB45DRAFT_112349 [Roridomyces roridus]|uniref:Protein YAE1 n=1 Tax=Roridomyces roridus TaxID=1738132 RepID=A0AAD7FJG4_9AGAR|nr:hypothetical protein FB45DRAFT_112349 [Roridomyces roridus]
MDLDSPWDDTAAPSISRDIEWTKISNEFTNVGYREGITAGKESALQEGFDDGFAGVGVPLGREIGALRGRAAALLAFVQSPLCVVEGREALLAEARAIASALANVRFTDVVPRDLEAEAHAREHLADDEHGVDENEELKEKRKMEGLEDMLAQLTAGAPSAGMGDKPRPTMEDVRALEDRLKALSARLGLPVERS